MKIRLNKKNVLIGVFLLSSMAPYRLTDITILKNIFNFIQLIGILYMVLEIFHSERLPKILVKIFIFEAILLLTAIIGRQDLYNCLVNILNQISMPVLLIYCFKRKKKNVLEVSYKYYYIISVINFIYLTIGINFMGSVADDSLFITEANSITPSLIYALVITGIYNIIFESRLLNSKIIILMIINAISEILVWSATGMIGYFMVVVGIVLYSGKKYNKKIPFYFLSVCILVLTVAIVVFQVQTRFIFLFENILQKSVDFTGRTSIWAVNIEKIKQSPLLGYGYGYRAVGNFYAHNGWIEILIEGGIILFIVFCGVVITTVKKSKRDNVSGTALGITQLLFIALLAFEVMMISEFPGLSYTFSFLIMLCYAQSIYRMCTNTGMAADIYKSMFEPHATSS